MYQAGIKNITLYENKGISFYFWDPNDLKQISNIENLGDVITIENMQRPEFDIEIKMLDSGDVGFDYSMKFFLLGMLLDNINQLKNIKKSIYGWCFLVEFYSGEYRFFNTPVFCDESKIQPHNEMSYEVELKSRVSSVQQYYEYTPGISSVPVFRFDTTLLSWDTEIYTFDYDL